MSDKHPLADARRTAELSQFELGQALSKQLKMINDQASPGHSETYLQKRVSLWENGKLQPAPDEVIALASIFELTRAEIEAWFERTPTSSEDLFRMLADAEHPSLIAVCYGGQPPLDPEQLAFKTLMEALNKNMSLLMFYPYPTDIELLDEDNEDFANMDALRLFYSEVRLSVEKRFEALFAQLAPQNRNSHLALYYPRMTDRANIPLPPHVRIFAYVVEFMNDSQFRSSVYVWVESKSRGTQLFRAGTYNELDPIPQMLAWRAYFGNPVNEWIESKGRLLPGTKSAPDAGRWVRKFSARDQTVDRDLTV